VRTSSELHRYRTLIFDILCAYVRCGKSTRLPLMLVEDATNLGKVIRRV
jgi:hypothetical protein